MPATPAFIPKMLSIHRQSQPIRADPARRLLQDTVIYGTAAPPLLLLPPMQQIQNQFPPNRIPSQSAPPAFSDDVNHFHPSVAIIMVVLLSAFFLLGFFSLYVRRCADGHSAEGRNSLRPGGELYHDHPHQGVDPDILHTLPLVAYSCTKKKGSTNVECVVCLTEFKEQEPLRQLPACKHVFHQNCIDMWLFSHSTCPLCRRNISVSNGSLSFRSWGGSGSFRLIPFLSRGNSAAQNLPPASEEHGTLSLIQGNRSETVMSIRRSFSAEIPSASSAGSRCAGEINSEDGCSTLQSSSNVQDRVGNVHTFAGNGGGQNVARRQYGTHLARANSTGHCLQLGLADEAGMICPPLPIRSQTPVNGQVGIIC